MIQSHSEADTARIGRNLAEELTLGGIVLLFGQLGVGKTAFVRGMVDGSGGLPDDVSSPTFTLIQQYAGRVPLTHVDLYRVAMSDVDELGLDELTGGPGIVAIEWADRLPWSLEDAVRVYIEDRGADEREIQIVRPLELATQSVP